MLNIIVDCQINNGLTYKGPNNNLSIYDKIAKNLGVTHALVLPTSTHVLDFGEFREESCIWEDSPTGVRYFKRIKPHNGEIREEDNPKSPSAIMNTLTLEKIRSLNRVSSIKYFFIPIVHPVLDTSEDLENFLSEKETVAIKIHGLSTHTTSNDIPEWIVTLANKYNKVVYIHTDFLNPSYEQSKNPTALVKIIEKNTPKSWLDWSMSKKVQKLHLSHLVRMDYDTMHAINALDNVVVGTGPDLMLQNEPHRLKNPTDDIFFDALRHLSDKRIVFSSDYAYNVKSRNHWSESDWQSITRLVDAAQLLKLTDEAIESMLGLNAIKFFELEK